MNLSRKLLWKIYAGAVGAATALIVSKALAGAWRAATGDEPPAVADPNTPTREAVVWAVASTAGMAVAAVLMNRLAAHTWEQALGEPAPAHRR